MYNKWSKTDIPSNINEAFYAVQELRGKPNPEYDQYYVKLETSYQRVLLENPLNYDNKRIIFLGDMDLTSLSLGMMSKPKDLAVLDIDKRIPEIVFKLKFDYKIRSIRFVNHDIRVRMLAILRNQFNYIFLEPPMTKEGLEIGLSRAVQCATKNTPSKIFLSFDIKKEDEEWIDRMVETMDLEIENKYLDFNRYEYLTPQEKNTSSMYILRVKNSSKETITNHYFGPIYFRESKMSPKPFRCKCGAIYKIGEKGDFESLKSLENKTCPICNYAGPFIYDSTVPIE